jgi:DNA-binding GntR family transcriptional regulator
MEVRRDCMRAQIRKVLVKRIVEGYYQPGDRLVELQIAREFRTSQGPVREALRELEALRLVESQTYRGTRVRLLTEREMREGGQVRGVLEEMAAREAAATLKGNVGPIRDEFEAIRQAARTQDLDGYAAHNMAFHRLIVAAAGNEVLLRVWDSLMLEVRTRIGLSQFHFDLLEVAETHRPILEALEGGDGEQAGRLLREHAESLCFWEQQGAAAMARAAAGQPAAVAN